MSTKYKDMLAELWRLQDDINKRCGCDWKALWAEKNPHKIGVWIQNYLLAADSEISEIRDCLAWKHWKTYGQAKRFCVLDFNHLQEEVIDLLHFVISLAQVAGMSAEECFAKYCQKNQINHKRQDDRQSSQQAIVQSQSKPGSPALHGPICPSCGSVMSKPAGRCWVCSECGNSSGGCE